MKKVYTVHLFLLIGVCSTFAQSQSQENKDLLLERLLEQQVKKEFRIEKYLAANATSRITYANDGSVIYLSDVSENGHPSFISTDNAGAAITSGAVELRNDGGLGLKLDGQGVTVGVWDGGGVLQDHQELAGRVRAEESGSAINFHATHVTGTIIAAGVDPAAKGMAPKARVLAYDFFGNPASEMVGMLEKNIITLSNHSWGSITGWRYDGSSWTWFGDESISEIEDYRFGFYSFESKNWDDIAYNYPNFTIVKSAGNDRSDSGDGSRPGDGPYDILGGRACAKNILTVGAVNKLSSKYTGPEGVVISSFSSWGPTDDGRIKPDIVGAGVQIYSTLEESTSDYGRLSGTSMSAPNVTGTLALIQQLSRNKDGKFLSQSMLKALTIHTAHEAGVADGPDYIFGWGLINAEGAARLLLNENGIDKLRREFVLGNAETFEIDFDVAENTKVTATIVWTDPSGNPVAASLDPTDLMLVNDLDMRIVSELNVENAPWILNPINTTQAATKGDNFRDNVEKIEFIAPTQERYTLKINHKGTLTNNEQVVSLILEYTSEEPISTVYWNGSNDAWSNSQNWQFSDDTPVRVPDDRTSVIVGAENSDLLNNTYELKLSRNESILNLTVLNDDLYTIDLNGFDLTIGGNLSTNRGNLKFIGEGSVIFTGLGLENNRINANASLSEVNVIFNNPEGSWLLRDGFDANEVSLNAGELVIQDAKIFFDQLITSSNDDYKNIIMENVTLNPRSSVDLTSGEISMDNVNMIIGSTEEVTLNFPNSEFNQIEVLVGGSLKAVTSLGTSKLISSGNVQFDQGGIVKQLEMNQGSEIVIGGGELLEIAEEITAVDFDIVGATINSNGGKAYFEYDVYELVCFDNLEVNNVDFVGQASVNVGENGLLTESLGWFSVACEEVLFSSFTTQYQCAGGLVYFQNNSRGAFDQSIWTFGDGSTTDSYNAFFTYNESGLYEVSLTITNSGGSSTLTQDIEIVENSSNENAIVLSGSRLASQVSADSYQWFFNGELVEGATDRTIVLGTVSGEYQVVTFSGDCNYITEPYVHIVLNTTDELMEDRLEVYPNPVNDVLYVKSRLLEEYKIFDLSGNEIISEKLPVTSNTDGVFEISLAQVKQGYYILRLINQDKIVNRKIIIRR
ncbi:MAG: S8 family serine peptidase [Cyclobacteriaceae bacterium]